MERNFLLTIIVGCVIASFSNAVRNVGKIPLNSAAFANLYENPNAQSPSEKYDLLLSTFSGNPFTSGTVNLYRGIGQQIKNIGSVRKEVLANRMSWPNEVAGVPGLFRIYMLLLKLWTSLKWEFSPLAENIACLQTFMIIFSYINFFRKFEKKCIMIFCKKISLHQCCYYNL